jgi:hypothetical protein
MWHSAPLRFPNLHYRKWYLAGQPHVANSTMWHSAPLRFPNLHYRRWYLAGQSHVANSTMWHSAPLHFPNLHYRRWYLAGQPHSTVQLLNCSLTADRWLASGRTRGHFVAISHMKTSCRSESSNISPVVSFFALLSMNLPAAAVLNLAVIYLAIAK